MSNNPKLSVIRDASNPNQTIDYEIYAKGLESQVTFALSGDVTGSSTGDLSSNLTIAATISNGAVSHDKLATDSVQNDKILSGTIALDKIAAAAFGNSDVATDNDGHIATHAQVVAYVTRLLQGYGENYGVLSVEDINAMTLDNLHNGDLVIVGHIGEPGHSATTVTLGGLTVRNGENLIFHKEGTGSSATGVWQSIDGEFKLIQTAVDAQGATSKTLTRLQQNANGDITATFTDISITSSQISDKTNTYSASGETVVTGKAIAAALGGLDAAITSSDGTNVNVKVTETDGKITAVNVTTDNTVAKVSSATAGNLASLTAAGGISDSGKSLSDLATSAQGTKADSAIQGVKLDGASAALSPDTNKVVTIPNAVATGETGATSGLMTAADKAKVESVTEGATKVETSTTNGNIKIDGNETTVYTHPTTTAVAAAAVKVGNDAAGHVVLGAALTKADVGLGNVNNTAIEVTSTSVSDGTTTFNKYVHPTDAGNKHIPAGGTTGDFLAYDSAGTAKWASNPAAGKADKVQNATSGNFAALDANGNLTDSTKKASDFATSSHTHGNITNAGTITATGVAIANGDALAIVDASDSSKVAKTSITFDGSTTNKALTPKGTWEEFNGASASSTTPAMDGTADAGSETAYARGDHVHPTDTSREPVFTMNYDSSDNALVFSKAFGTVSSGN